MSYCRNVWSIDASYVIYILVLSLFLDQWESDIREISDHHEKMMGVVRALSANPFVPNRPLCRILTSNREGHIPVARVSVAIHTVTSNNWNSIASSTS
jgi:hypothetical protein